MTGKAAVASAIAPCSRRGIRAKQVRGVPDLPLIPLYPLHLSEGVKTAVNAIGLAYGFKVDADAVISWAPTPLPQMKVSRFLACVEFTGMDHRIESSFCLHWIWVDKFGKTHSLYTQPIVANGGDFFRFELPVHLVPRDRDTVFTCALRITLMDKKPILIRGAWLEIID